MCNVQRQASQIATRNPSFKSICTTKIGITPSGSLKIPLTAIQARIILLPHTQRGPTFELDGLPLLGFLAHSMIRCSWCSCLGSAALHFCLSMRRAILRCTVPLYPWGARWSSSPCLIPGRSAGAMSACVCVMREQKRESLSPERIPLPGEKRARCRRRLRALAPHALCAVEIRLTGETRHHTDIHAIRDIQRRSKGERERQAANKYTAAEIERKGSYRKRQGVPRVV